MIPPKKTKAYMAQYLSLKLYSLHDCLQLQNNYRLIIIVPICKKTAVRGEKVMGKHFWTAYKDIVMSCNEWCYTFSESFRWLAQSAATR